MERGLIPVWGVSFCFAGQLNNQLTENIGAQQIRGFTIKLLSDIW